MSSHIQCMELNGGIQPNRNVSRYSFQDYFVTLAV